MNEGKKYNITHVMLADEKIAGMHKASGEKYEFDDSFTIDWVAEGFGFGCLTFLRKGDQLFLDSEMMNKEFCMAVLQKFLETCAQNMVG